MSRSPFLSVTVSIPFTSKGTVALLRHNNTATTQAQLAGSATTADGSRSHSKQQTQNTVYKKATS